MYGVLKHIEKQHLQHMPGLTKLEALASFQDTMWWTGDSLASDRGDKAHNKANAQTHEYADTFALHLHIRKLKRNSYARLRDNPTDKCMSLPVIV